MTDIYTIQERSKIMSRIRSSGTAPEEALYSVVRELLGDHRRIDRNVSRLPGQPDIIVPSLKLAIFADGCFYHCCPNHGRKPKSNVDYWIPKLSRNRKRDRANRAALRKMRYTVWSVWEHSLKKHSIQRTSALLKKRLASFVMLRRCEIKRRNRSIR
jgi:DNA mismatch endonuclease (patch repair protein)